jgi:hypothetical protein
VAPPGSPAEFAAEARQFQSPAFRQAIDALRERLVEQFAGTEPTGIVQA